MTKELLMHGNIFCFILFRNKVTSSNISLEISTNIIGRTAYPKHAFQGTLFQPTDHMTNTETDFREPWGSPVKVR